MVHCNIKMQFTEDEGRNLSISLFSLGIIINNNNNNNIRQWSLLIDACTE